MILLAALSIVLAQGEVLHTFVYVADQDLKTVSVAGTFNNWNKDARILEKQKDGRTWKTTYRLSPGKHSYKFVLDGDRWVTDPRAVRNEDDGNGNTNSILIILPAGYDKPAMIGDGMVTQSAIRHVPHVPDLNYDRGQLTIMLRARPNDVGSVAVQFGSKRIPMKMDGADDLYANYVCSLPWSNASSVSYSFVLDDRGGIVYYGVDGFSRTPTNGFTLSPQLFKPFEVPQWVEKSVFYQIFPDRFDNGDQSNDPQDVVAWDAKPEWFNHFGGDVAGVRKRIPYLRQLGISSVYFNPVFSSPSNHRYDATDYLKIDPKFGTNEEFIAMTNELDKVGIRPVVDGVFNHTATDFWAFKDIIDKGEKSKFKDWYFIKSYPVVPKDPPNYEAWFGFAAMPKLNLANPETQKYMLDVPKFWMDRAKIYGWRLDVANEVPDWYWRLFRNKVKGISKDTWIVGEVWGDGSHWLKGDQWDSAMNYQFRDAVLGFVAEEKTSASQFANRLMQVYRQNVPQVSRNMMNLLGSHDTPRILTLCKNDPKLALLAATIQFGWIGAPSIYYGDEIGMQGDRDPDNRRAMAWSEASPNNDFLSYYKRLIAARNSCPALQSGDPLVLSTDDSNKVLIIGRAIPNGNSPAALVVNRSDSEQTVMIPSKIAGQSMSSATDLASTARQWSLTPKGIRVVLRPKSAALFGQRSGKALSYDSK